MGDLRVSVLDPTLESKRGSGPRPPTTFDTYLRISRCEVGPMGPLYLKLGTPKSSLEYQGVELILPEILSSPGLGG